MGAQQGLLGLEQCPRWGTEPAQPWHRSWATKPSQNLEHRRALSHLLSAEASLGLVNTRPELSRPQGPNKFCIRRNFCIILPSRSPSICTTPYPPCSCPLYPDQKENKGVEERKAHAQAVWSNLLPHTRTQELLQINKQNSWQEEIPQVGELSCQPALMSSDRQGTQKHVGTNFSK